MFGVNISKMGKFPNLIVISQSKRLNVKKIKNSQFVASQATPTPIHTGHNNTYS
jgi:hypothetical protein